MTALKNGQAPKKRIMMALGFAGLMAMGSIAQVELERWNFTAPDGGNLTTAPSEYSSLNWGGTTMAIISNNMARFTATGVDNEGAFAGKKPAALGSGVTNGIYEVSYDVPFADMALTAAAGLTAQGGFGLRDNETVLSTAKRNAITLFRWNSTQQYTLTVTGDGNQSVVLAPVGQTTISNVNVRTVIDLDKRGLDGSMVVYYSVDGGPEQTVSHKIHADFVLDEVRMQVQALNGGNGWQPGDEIYFDNVILSEVPQADLFVAAQVGKEYGAGTKTTNDIASLTVEAGDMIVVAVGGNVGSGPALEDLSTSGTAILESFGYQTFSGNGPRAVTYHAKAASAGTVDLELILPNYAAVGSYVLRAQSGVVEMLDMQGSRGSSGSQTNVYDFGKVASGILIETHTTYGNDPAILTPGMKIDYSNNASNPKRAVASGTFEDVSGLQSVWTNVPNGYALAGIAFEAGEPADGTFLAQTVGFQVSASTGQVATLAVNAGDYVAVTAAGNQGSWTQDVITFSGTATLGREKFEKSSKAATMHAWYAPVLSNGTVDVTLTLGDGIGEAAAYVIRAGIGEVNVLTSAGAAIDNNTFLSVTNIYDFGGVTNGLILEGISSYANDGNGMSTDNADFVVDQSTDTRRQVGHIAFEGLSGMTNIWTATTNRQAAVLGVVFVEGDGIIEGDTPQSLYEDWLADNGYPEDAPVEDYLIEYASGGSATMPVAVEEADYFIHVHTEWKNAEARGLSYVLELDANANLTMALWSTNGIESVGSGDLPGGELISVTNRVPSTDAQEFLRLNVEFD